MNLLMRGYLPDRLRRVHLGDVEVDEGLGGNNENLNRCPVDVLGGFGGVCLFIELRL